jgi:DNA processing protein
LTNSALKARLTEVLTLLSVPGVGRGRYHALVRAFGSPSAIFEAGLDALETVPGISRKTASAIRAHDGRDAAGSLAARIVQLGWTVLFSDSPEYPRGLTHLDIPPPLLFCTGRPIDPAQNLIAVVGTRHPTEAGRQFARRLGADLAAVGIGVVSGMADGIDAEAHQGALDAGGTTIAVWGTSLDIVYPPVHRQLADRIREHGTIISEYPPGTRPDRAFFPERNRIISGLSEGVVVVEAGSRSGALITAHHALEQGRELFAVPGSPTAAGSTGTNDLIKRGARLLTSIDDIFEELPRLRGEVSARRFKSDSALDESEQSLVDALTAGPLHIDALSRSLDVPMTALMATLLALELKGIVTELSGKRYSLARDAR